MNEQILQQYKVLLVDDIPMNLQILGTMLDHDSLELYYSNSGIEALKILEQLKPDLILLDITMPDMDGYEVCKRIKNHQETEDIPVIFITANSLIDDIVKGFKVGAIDYITKPFNSQELISRVFTHLELKRSRDIIKTQNQKLQDLNATKDKFFSILAHDLKNPFNALLGFSELLYKRFDTLTDESKKEFITFLYHSSKKGYNLLTNLLEWGRSQSGHIELKQEIVDIGILVEDTIDLFHFNAEKKDIHLENKIPVETLLFADRHMTETIIRNLISNAIKFTSQEGKVSIYHELETSFSRISVKDSGIGISEENQKKLFRIDTTITTSGTELESGTGLGLILCKEFIEKHGGTISCTSDEGKGSTFSFTLPTHNE